MVAATHASDLCPQSCFLYYLRLRSHGKAVSYRYTSLSISEVMGPPPAPPRESAAKALGEAAAEWVLLLLGLLVHRVRVVDVLARIVTLAQVVVTKHFVCSCYLPSRGWARRAFHVSPREVWRGGHLANSYARPTFLNMASAAGLSSSRVILSGWYL